jgi:hypothetical protein
MLEETLTRSEVTVEIEAEAAVDTDIQSTANGSKHLPDALRQQREAILGFANRPDAPDSEV